MTAKNISQSFENYIPCLYSVEMKNRRLIPEVKGVYFIWEESRIYCGSTNNLAKRVKGSSYERGFGKVVFYFPEFLLNGNQAVELHEIRTLEENCISALLTISYGNGLFLDLTNSQGSYLLPEYVWKDKRPNEFSLAIKIAQTILFGIGIPIGMIGLPNYHAMCSTWSPRYLRKSNEERWGEILSAERVARQSNYSQQPPLHLFGSVVDVF